MTKIHADSTRIDICGRRHRAGRAMSYAYLPISLLLRYLNADYGDSFQMLA